MDAHLGTVTSVSLVMTVEEANALVIDLRHALKTHETFVDEDHKVRYVLEAITAIESQLEQVDE